MKSKFIIKVEEEHVPFILPSNAIELADLCEELWKKFHQYKSKKIKEQYNQAAELYNQKYFKVMKIL